MNQHVPAKIEKPAVTAVRGLLRELIDYAGLFPPAALSMSESVANYDAYSRSEWNWLLGRFVLPVARLPELEQAVAARRISTNEEHLPRWRISALLGSDPVEDIARMRDFSERMAKGSSPGFGSVESVEVKVSDPSEIKEISLLLLPEWQAYFEIPLSCCEELVGEISACRQRRVFQARPWRW